MSLFGFCLDILVTSCIRLHAITYAIDAITIERIAGRNF